MNKIYKVVWSKVKHCYVVTSELAKRNGKGRGARSLRMAAVTIGVAAALLGDGHPLFGMPVAEAKTTTVQLGNKIVNTTVDYTTVFNFQYPEKSITVGETEIYEVSNAYGVFGNVAQRMGKETTDSLSFKVVDGQLIEVHNVTMSYVVDDKNPYQRVLAVHPFNYSKGTDAEIDDEIKNSDGAKADVSSYTVTMTGGSLQEVTGGLSYSGNVSNNTVNLDGGTAYKVYGGYTVGGAAETNHVVLNGGIAGVSGTIVSGGELYGAYSYNDSGNSGNVTGNTVTVDKSGIVMAPVYGGSTEAHDSGNASGNAVGNIVTIKDGTLSGNIYGGYSDAQYKTSGNVEGNQVIIKGGVLKSAPVTINGTNYNTDGVRYIRGGYTSGYDKDTDTNASGIAKDNEVTISGGTFRSDVEVAGGYSNANNAEHNIVNIESTFTGTVGKVTGGEAGGNGTVTKNEVTISGGTVGTASASPADEYAEGVVYGAYSVSSSVNTGDVTGNTVTIKSGTVGNTVQAVIGGLTRATGSSGNSGKATGNTVTIEGGTIAGIVRGGASMSSQNTAGEVKENSVIIKGGELKTTTNIDYEAHTVTSYRSDIYGGYLEGDENSGVVQDNTVTISGGDFTSAKIYGGYSNASNAVHNTVEFTKDFTAPERNFITVAGGASSSGNAIKNVVTIGGGNIGRYEYNVYGGYSETGTAGGTAGEGNTVTITGGKVEGSAVGGFSKSGAVKNNVVTVSGSETEVSDIRGGSSWTGTVSENTATIQGGWVGYAYGGFSSDGTANGNKLNISGVKVGGGVYGGDAPTTTYNAVTISEDAEISTPYLTGGRSFNYQTGGVATGNTFTILGGTFSGVAEYNYSIVGGFTDGNGTAKDNAVNLTGAVTGLENFELYGYVNATTHSGNELHIGGTKTYDSEGNATVNSGDVWQGKNSDGTVNNKVESVSNFERIVLHNVAWNEDVAALEATTVENVGTLDIKDLKFDQTPTSGSMALLKSGNVLGASGVGIGLAYKDGSTEKTATSAELATGVTFDSGKLEDTAVNGVTLTGTQSKKVSLEDEDKTIMYSFSSSVDGITIATDTFTADGTARTFGKGVTLTGATITNNLAFSPASKKNMASGTSMVILDATEAVAVSGATLPTFDATTYDVDFSDAIDSKVVTLSGKHTDTLAMNDTTARTQLIYTVGDKNVETATFNGAVDFSTGDAYYKADSQYKFSATNVDAKNLTFNETTEALTKDSSMTLLSATGLTAGTITQPDAPTVAINYGGDATNGITFNAVATGSVAVESGAMKFKVNAVEAETIDLSNWNGTTTDVSTATSGWTLKAGETVETGDLAKADLFDLKPGDTKTILTASNTIVFTNDAITGNKKWKEGGTSIAETSHESGVVISAGETTGSGVKVNENKLIYQQGKNNVTGITLGEVTFNTAKAAREFGNAYDLTAADIDATGFAIKDAETATMNAGEEMIVLDATKAIKKADGTALKGFTDEPGSIAVDFTDKKVDGKELTFEGTHVDTLSLNNESTQVVYKVGEKEVNKSITFTGEVAWNDSEAYYDAAKGTAKYIFAAVDVDATNLKVTGETAKALKTGDAMTLLSATGMSANTFTDQSDANKTASKVAVNYKDKASGIGFVAEATGQVKAGNGELNYEVTGVTLNSVDLASWNGTTADLAAGDTSGWTAEDQSVVVNNVVAITYAPSSTQVILTAGSGMFKDVNVAKEVAFEPVTKNGVTLSGVQTNTIKTTQTNVANDTITYEIGKKDVKTIALGSVAWGGETLDGSDYNYAGAAYDAKNFAMTFTDPSAVAANDSMTLLEANETLTAMVAEEKAKIEKTYDVTPVSGVDVNATLKGKVTTADGQVKVTAESNQANTISFGKVEWTGDTPLIDHSKTLANVSFDGATVDTSAIDFYKEMYIEADQTTTLVSGFGEEAKITDNSTKYSVGTGFEGESETKLEGGNLILRTKTSAGVSEQTHKAVMAVDANMALLATGNEYVGQVLAGLGDPANAGRDGVSTAAAIGGGWNRYNTGSHVNVNSWNAAVGIGAKRDLKNGSLEYGVFGEYGKGNYKLHSEVGSSDGDAHYAGGGLLAKWTNKHDVYTEASFRFGRMSDSANDLLRDGAGNAYGYNVHANYFGAHAGIGKIFRYKGGKSLDVYGKYFYTKRDGVEFDAKQHYNLDSVKSSLLRIGARYGTTDKKWNWYGGLAYEYEFDGEATGTVKDTAIRAASIKGSSVRGEIGMRMNATKTNPWQMDISLYGYGGKHRGFGGNVNVAYMF